MLLVKPKRLMRLMRLAALVCVAVALPSVAAQPQGHVTIPDFTLTDNQDRSWQLADYHGQPKVFMFWATWCPHCKKLFPTIQSIHERYESAGLEVVAISVFCDGDTYAYAQRRGLTMDVLKRGDALAQSLNVPGTPTVIILNGDNQLVYGAVSPDPADTTIESVVQRLLGLTPIENPCGIGDCNHGVSR